MSEQKQLLIEQIARKIFFAQNRKPDFQTIHKLVHSRLVDRPFINRADIEEIEQEIVGTRLRNFQKPPPHPKYFTNLQNNSRLVDAKKIYHSHMQSSSPIGQPIHQIPKNNGSYCQKTLDRIKVFKRESSDSVDGSRFKLSTPNKVKHSTISQKTDPRYSKDLYSETKINHGHMSIETENTLVLPQMPSAKTVKTQITNELARDYAESVQRRQYLLSLKQKQQERLWEKSQLDEFRQEENLKSFESKRASSQLVHQEAMRQSISSIKREQQNKSVLFESSLLDNKALQNIERNISRKQVRFDQLINFKSKNDSKMNQQLSINLI